MMQRHSRLLHRIKNIKKFLLKEKENYCIVLMLLRDRLVKGTIYHTMRMLIGRRNENEEKMCVFVNRSIVSFYAGRMWK